MSIIYFNVGQAAQVGEMPRRNQLVSSDSLASITSPGYLNNSNTSGKPISPTDIFDVVYNYVPTSIYSSASGFGSGTYAQFYPQFNSGVITLVATSAQQVGPQVITTALASAAPGTVRSLVGTISDTTTITSGNLVGVRGSVTIGSITGGYCYGIQGKFIATGTISNSGGGFECGVLGQFDLSAATLGSTSYIAPIWSDFGATATSGTYAQAFLYSGTNSTAAILGAQINLYGGATSLMDLTDNNALVGATYFVASGTGSGSWGNATAPTPSKVLKITVNGVAYYLPLVAQNS